MFESIILKVNAKVFKSSPDVVTLSHSRLWFKLPPATEVSLR